MKAVIQTFGVFLFTALLFIKVSALHSYSHHDSDETQDCTVCVISLENQQENFNYTYSVEFTPEHIYSNSEQSVAYKSITLTTEFKFYLFGRPPPTALSLV